MKGKSFKKANSKFEDQGQHNSLRNLPRVYSLSTKPSVSLQSSVEDLSHQLIPFFLSLLLSLSPPYPLLLFSCDFTRDEGRKDCTLKPVFILFLLVLLFLAIFRVKQEKKEPNFQIGIFPQSFHLGISLKSRTFLAQKPHSLKLFMIQYFKIQAEFIDLK